MNDDGTQTIKISVNMKQNHKIRLFYFMSESNFGDVLTLVIFNKLFGLDVEQAGKKYSDIVAIGSLLECIIAKPSQWFKIFRKYFYPCLLVWGTGFIEEQQYENQKLKRRVDIRAVRGYNTLERLRRITGKPLESVVVADPGLLAGRLIDASQINKKYALGIIPHYVDKGNPLLEKIKVKNAVVIDIQQSPEEFLKRLAECENVISSAMHGLIAADSLGIPNIRMTLSDKILGGDYKYNDYYSAFGLDSHIKIDLARFEFLDKDLPNIRINYKIKPDKVTELQEALIASFPYKGLKNC